MITIYQSTEDGKLIELEDFKQDSWIHCTAPTTEEILQVAEKCRIPVDYLQDPLDSEESARIEYDEATDCTIIINDFPVPGENEGQFLSYTTLPIGIIITKSYIVTVCLKEAPFLNQLQDKIVTKMKSRLALQILFAVSTLYLQSLDKLNRQRITIEKKLKQSLTNKQLFNLLEIEKSLVYFLTSIRTNNVVLKKILRAESIPLYDDDKDLLEDVLIESTQAMETTELYSSILDSITNSYSSLISNEMNYVMKTLTLFTIFLTLPTLVFSFFGMNVALPITNNGLSGWFITIIISIVLCIAVALFLWRKKIFKK
ncbi:magnesium transporter CorA family protein [Gracilibacillus oryzae]|uniref:Magnesium transporter CorA family protein n=1 Tax=Gracilibacillus oryzae TaxID=1672701 RepID=A0A7C8GRE5_9BACI|nr:magnesium transporter CorA family protein [Gracilibacillus oryzae]KAB8127473.1 magnesium transporter CorA family protein [Gracilibacillus oryzae]